MPRFSSSSLHALGSCHLDLQALFHEVIKHIDCTVIEGHRNKEAQDRAVEEGKSQLLFPLSNHNKLPALAVDVVPYPIDWNNRERFCYFAGFVKGIAQKMYEEGKIEHHIRWGGDWNQNDNPKDERFSDMPHFELI